MRGHFPRRRRPRRLLVIAIVIGLLIISAAVTTILLFANRDGDGAPVNAKIPITVQDYAKVPSLGTSLELRDYLGGSSNVDFSILHMTQDAIYLSALRHRRTGLESCDIIAVSRSDKTERWRLNLSDIFAGRKTGMGAVSITAFTPHSLA